MPAAFPSRLIGWGVGETKQAVWESNPVNQTFGESQSGKVISSSTSYVKPSMFVAATSENSLGKHKRQFGKAIQSIKARHMSSMFVAHIWEFSAFLFYSFLIDMRAVFGEGGGEVRYGEGGGATLLYYISLLSGLWNIYFTVPDWLEVCMVRIGGAGKITSKLGKQAGQSEPTASQSGKTWSSNFCLVVVAIFTFLTPLSLSRSQQLGFMYLKSHILHLIAALPTFVMCTSLINITKTGILSSARLGARFGR